MTCCNLRPYTQTCFEQPLIFTLEKSIDKIKFTYYSPNQSFCENNLYKNAIREVLSLFHGNLNVLLHVLYKIINKMYVKAEITQNDTDLSCIKLDIYVSKCFRKAQHFETLISV